jgi:ribose transport system permease protein
VIAAVVLGGTGLFGGSASTLGAVVGSLLIVLIRNGLVLMGLAVSEQDMILGLLLVVALALGGRK